MNRDKNKMAEKILNLTLEIIFHLTGEDYTVVKTSSDRCQAPVSEGRGGTLSPIPGPPPHPRIHEDINDQKILELTNKMLELLTGEVPIRCQDVTVYFSMEEWEYLEGHKERYKEVILEEPQPRTSPAFTTQVNSSDITDWTFTDAVIPDYFTGNSQGYLLSSDVKAEDDDVVHHTYEEDAITPDIQSAFHIQVLPSDPYTHALSPDSQQLFEQNIIPIWGVKQERACTQEKPFTCSECNKYLITKAGLISHMKTHSEKKSYSCPECGKCFNWKSALVRHAKTHTREKLYACSECGKCFTYKSVLVRHQKTHTKDKSSTYSKSVKRNDKASLVAHQKMHKGEKPLSCTICGKCFVRKSVLIAHEKAHKRNKMSCPECGKCFTNQSYLLIHERTHTGEKPFSCPECGRCFNQKSNLVTHQKIHTGEKPYSCPQCEKGFFQKINLLRHQRTH
ncbi:uncharacterized protein ACNLHF_026016 [Anomaloglossus baeobatrachus]|uniref:uncharacterized protein LOC142257757 n=1 Tax=Anomaloglossus baeobatrachus TaxID=238106 RepID=UPI003F4F563A